MPDTAIPGLEDLGIDPDALEAKYQLERDRRLRADGEQQFLEVTTTGAHSDFLLADPYARAEAPRAPLTVTTEVAIIGGGWVGLMTAARLIEADASDVRIVDGGSDFGGTWYWNRYPGAQCDIESYIYLPLLEETGNMPRERSSYAPEIFEHAQRITRRYGLRGGDGAECLLVQGVDEPVVMDEARQYSLFLSRRAGDGLVPA